ncbi:DUF459 domain-containing protein [Mesorhizobium sp. J428]|uniref:SGNH/GDSL hydrolase family protein n=1 Tax=Mesorhizobium sp. J428 TaxID=2898440 RepID=UPI002151EBE4|nr:DUF459 domain-containing protein [Mesorhizobium sp. J428]MCR5855939.1 DUF459 domain-containing protein [Mesorhizobium sp. J428]
MSSIAPVFAQDRPRSLFDFLFRSNRPRPEVEIPEKLPPPTIKRKTPASASERSTPAPEAVAKAENARVVLVVGDFLASGLAEGLESAYATLPDVRVVVRANGSSGIVRDDFYNWPAEIGGIIEQEKPAAVVVMLGANDRQEMRVGDVREPKRSENWMKEYERRAVNLAKAVTDRSIPLVWVGMPSFKNSTMASDMLAYNDVYRSAAEAAGGSFVDIWDGFVDENGAFVSTGPDINGNPVRLRSGENGINLTRPGKRKVAFYAEKPLEKILGTARPAQIGAIGPNGLVPQAPGAVAPVDIDRTVPISLSDPELNGGQELLGATFKPGVEKPQTAAEKLTKEGIAPRPVAGRADDFGDGVPAKSATGIPPAAAEKTTAIAN